MRTRRKWKMRKTRGGVEELWLDGQTRRYWVNCSVQVCYYNFFPVEKRKCYSSLCCMITATQHPNRQEMILHWWLCTTYITGSWWSKNIHKNKMYILNIISWILTNSKDKRQRLLRWDRAIHRLQKGDCKRMTTARAYPMLLHPVWRQWWIWLAL